jgi:hypothetical protein
VTTILERERYHGLPDEQRRELSAAETMAHTAALEINQLLQVYLSDPLKERALDAAAIGMFSALGRLIAEHRPAALGEALITSGHAIMRQEHAHWLRIAGGDHVRH